MPKYNFKVAFTFCEQGSKVYTILDILSVNAVSENMGNYLYLWGIKKATSLDVASERDSHNPKKKTNKQNLRYDIKVLLMQMY